MRRFAFFLTLWTLFAMLPVSALEVGDPAPPVALETWIHGAGLNPAEADGKHIYVVEFWATWCGPCRQTIPLMNALHRDYADRGLHIMGVTNEDRATVETFMQSTPMTYNVALDPAGATAVYQEGSDGIPYAVVVGREGRVLWTGHPLDGMKHVVRAAVEGSFTLEVAKRLAAAKKRFDEAAEANDAETALKALDTLIAVEPHNTQHYMIKVRILSMVGREREAAAVLRAWDKAVATSAEGSARLAEMAMNFRSIPARDPALALRAATRAATLSEGKDPRVQSVVANTYAKLGLFEEAIETAETVLKNAAGQRETMLEDSVAYWRAILAARREAKADGVTKKKEAAAGAPVPEKGAEAKAESK